jgi:hypothetical protein
VSVHGCLRNPETGGGIQQTRQPHRQRADQVLHGPVGGGFAQPPLSFRRSAGAYVVSDAPLYLPQMNAAFTTNKCLRRVAVTGTSCSDETAKECFKYENRSGSSRVYSKCSALDLRCHSNDAGTWDIPVGRGLPKRGTHHEGRRQPLIVCSRTGRSVHRSGFSEPGAR